MHARTGISSRKAQNRTFPHLSKKPCSQRVFSLDGVLRYSCFSSPVSLVYYIYYYARCQLVAHFTFEIALSGAIMLTLLLVCSFSPRKYKSILRGFYNKDSLKSQNFDEIVFFSAGSEKSSVLWRTRFFGFRRKSKISQNYDFLICLAKTFPIFPKSCIIVNPYFS